MLIRRSEAQAGRRRLAETYQGLSGSGADRRSFLKQAGLGGAGLAALGALPPRLAQAQTRGRGEDRTVAAPAHQECLHPLLGRLHRHRRGAERRLDRAGAGLRIAPSTSAPTAPRAPRSASWCMASRRLKYPMKLVGGEWQRHLLGPGDRRDRRTSCWRSASSSAPEAVFWLGSAKFTNEAAYLFRKFGAFWGTNNTDHQARICHSTTVAGVANTFGYGAQTNSFNDIRNSKAMMVMGGNPAEAHPIAMQHLLRGQGAEPVHFFVVDPRFTRTAAHATDYVRIRPGTDIPVIWGMLWHIFQNGWEDKEYIAQRVYGMDEIRARGDEVDAAGGRAGDRRAGRAAASAWRRSSPRRSRRP